MDVKTYEQDRVKADRERQRRCQLRGAGIVVMLGPNSPTSSGKLAPTAPDTQFLIVDQCIENQPDNVHCAVFREYRAKHLMGVAPAAC
ncbi:MAG: BMP family ABC transporter substrate-binding protein [Rhizobiaceae bacterium]|nr:BMP family ABC transporter substrate-binding protein [Rhizobiaceae bacterium]